MKKKLILTIALLFVGVFSFSVSAASQSASVTGSNYIFTVVANFYDNDSVGSYFDVSVTIKNLQPEKWVTSSQCPSITFNVPSSTQFHVFDSVDCAPVISSYGVVSLNPVGGIVLAPNEVVQYHFKFLASGGSTVTSISLGTVPSSSAYSFDDLTVLPADELAYLQQLDGRLSDLIDAVVFSGSHFYFDPSSSNEINTSVFNSDGVSVNVVRRVGSSYLIDSNVISDSYSDVDYAEYTYRVPVILSIVVTNSNNSTVRTTRFLSLNNILTTNSSYYFSLDYMSSDLFDSFTPGRSIELRYRNRDYNYGYIGERSRNYTIIYGHIDVPDNITLTWPTVDSLSTSSTFSSGYSNYSPRDEFSILKDIYNAFANSDRSDQDQLSDDITSTSNSIHTQEEQYFSSNAQAIQATGLSNYRFDQNQTGGISAVSNDFTAVFNALGGFNSVFIFSLTLSLALQIFRHHPIVFRAKQVNAAPKVGKGDP